MTRSHFGRQYIQKTNDNPKFFDNIRHNIHGLDIHNPPSPRLYARYLALRNGVLYLATNPYFGMTASERLFDDYIL
jgi:hypothetical protein